MHLSRISFLLAVLIALLIPKAMFAGTLDEAPFRVVLPDAEWQLDDSASRPMGNDTFLVAMITNTNTLVRSVVLKIKLKKGPGSALDEFSSGIRDSVVKNPAAKILSEGETTFLGYKSKQFAYQITQGVNVIYNEATVFIADGIGWTIACVDRSDQKDQIKQLAGFFRKKGD